MKIKLFILGIVAGIMFLSSCNDDMGLVGPSMQPEEDTPTIRTDTFKLKASTVLLDSIYAKTATGLLGELYDPLFGNLKADFICQFYIQENFKFRQEPIDGKIDTVGLILSFPRSSWIGDSLAPMQATVYPVVKPLERKYYTNINPADYVNMQQPLGMQAYTARDMSISDSAYINSNFSPSVSILLPNEIGERFYKASMDGSGAFANQDRFNEFFPGLYVTNTFGSGSILVINDSRLYFSYRYYTERKSTGVKDSVVTMYELFPVTKEVIQMNRMQNADLDKLLAPNDDYTYLKSPAGVATRLTIPTKEIIEKVKDRRINTFFHQLKVMPQNDWKYALAPPTYVLMLPEDSAKTFFEKGKIEDNITTYLGTYNSTSLAYTFNDVSGNLANLIKYQMQYAPDKDLDMLIIPVERGTTASGSGSSAVPTTESISNYLKPSGITIRKDPEVMQVQVITSIYDK